MTQFAIYAGICIAALLFLIWSAGPVVINDNQVGIVTKRFGAALKSGIVATNGEAGVQATTLAPGWHFFMWPWKYLVDKVEMIVVPESELALVIANDGQTIPEGRKLGDRVACDNYQDGSAFLAGGGFKGRQLGMLMTGTYRINTRLFTVVTKANALKVGLLPEQLTIIGIHADNIGIVTVLDGKPLPAGEIAAPVIEGHESFQNAQAFISNGGFVGLQQSVLLPGAWAINPWFATVEATGMTNIPVAHVGVVTSYVGNQGIDVSGADFKYADLVENGNRGVWAKPLNPGVYSINPYTAKVEIVPTSNFVLNWGKRTEEHALDADLSAITVQSRDGFTFPMEVQQIIHVHYEVAPRLIARFGTMAKLVQNVLEPLVGNYFRNAGQGHDAMDFILSREERQSDAKQYVTDQLRAFDVEGVDTLIGGILPPPALMTTLQDRKIAEESKKTIVMQMETEKDRQNKERQTALADSQRELVASEQAVLIATQHAEASKAQAAGAAAVAITQAEAQGRARKIEAESEGEALKLKSTNEGDSIKLIAAARADETLRIGTAEAEVVKLRTAAVGQDAYAAIEVARALSASNLRLVPDIQFGGSAAGSSPVDGLLGMLAAQFARANFKTEDHQEIEDPTV